MFENLSFWQLLQKGGWTMVALLVFSMISWYIIVERAIRFRQASVDPERLLQKIKKIVLAGKHVEAADLCQETPGPVAAALEKGLRYFSKGAVAAREAMERASALEVIRLEHFLSTLATIGSISPFVGLFGTVLGIIRAFSSLAGNNAAGATVVAGGIAEALVATAAGLFTAVPAVIAYNYFVRRVTRFDADMAAASSELLETLYEKTELHGADSSAGVSGRRPSL